MLSDFLGNHTVYTRGLPNTLESDDRELPLKLANARALCENVLEPLLEQAGPMSISYGYIRPETSDKIVTYQDPRKPSHHQWNLGAAADICIHEFTNHDPKDDTEKTAPITLAHAIENAGYPYSRLITYSESPFLCIAVSAEEIRTGSIRKAFYENRYVGQKSQKPVYKSYSTQPAKARALATLEQTGLAHGWRGAGYPTYHGGGRKQYHHHRISQYTMLSDWLFNLQSISNGWSNVPALNDRKAMNAFARAGCAYDHLIAYKLCNRLSITQGYVSPSNKGYVADDHDWIKQPPCFQVAVPTDCDIEELEYLYRDNPGPIHSMQRIGDFVIQIEAK